MFSCKKLFKLQIRPPSLILLITASQDRWIFHSQSWEVKNSIIIIIYFKFYMTMCYSSRSQWPRGLRRRSTAAWQMRLWVRIVAGAWMSVCCECCVLWVLRVVSVVCCECCVLSGRDLCDGLITRPERSYRLWCVVLCDLDTSWMIRPRPTGWQSRQVKNRAWRI